MRRPSISMLHPDVQIYARVVCCVVAAVLIGCVLAVVIAATVRVCTGIVQ